MAKPLARRRLGAVVEDIVTARLDEARMAFARLQDPADVEALHDFRVALRRLRSCLKDYARASLSETTNVPGVALPKRLRRQVRDLARQTSPARDAEVVLAWLEAGRDGASRAERGAVDWWRERLGQEVHGHYQALGTEVARFPLLDAELRRLFGSPRLAKGSPRFGEAASLRLVVLSERLFAELAEITGRDDEKALHRPRITAKRIRYLLRPWRDEDDLLKEAEVQMKRFQEVFGRLHDGLVRATSLGEAARRHAKESMDERLALAVGGESARATAPVHLKGFMALSVTHEQQLAHDFAAAMALATGQRVRQLEQQLARAAERMKALAAKTGK